MTPPSERSAHILWLLFNWIDMLASCSMHTKLVMSIVATLCQLFHIYVNFLHFFTCQRGLMLCVQWTLFILNFIIHGSCTFEAINELICQSYWLELIRFKLFFIDIIFFLESTKIWVDFEHELWMTFLFLCDLEEIFFKNFCQSLRKNSVGAALLQRLITKVLKSGDFSPKQTIMVQD